MPFVGENDDPKFVKGFECGQIWTKMSDNFKFESYLIHTENIDQLKLMAKRFGYSIEIENFDDTWSYFSGKIDPSKLN